MSFSRPVSVVIESESGLIRQRWVFSLQGTDLMLDRYHHERRRAITQPFITAKFYDRQRQVGEDYGDWTWLTEEEVPWDDELKEWVLAEFAKNFRVVRQSDL